MFLRADRAKPWYREPWPWLLMAGPAAVAVAGAVTVWLAVATSDGPVADDHHNGALATSQSLARDRVAAALAYRARLSLGADGRVRVALVGGHALPEVLTLRLTHPTRAGLDRVLRLERRGAGAYEGTLMLPPAVRWLVALGDEAGTWRLTGEWPLPAHEPLELAPRTL